MCVDRQKGLRTPSWTSVVVESGTDSEGYKQNRTSNSVYVELKKKRYNSER